MEQSAHKDELDLLICCLRARWNPQALEEARAGLRGGIAEERLLQLAQAEGVAALLYETVRGQNLLSAQAEEALRQTYYATASRAYPLFHELERLLGGLARQGIAVILLKGAALAAAVYRNLSVRPMGDLDLFVRRADVPPALSLLQQWGYVVGQAEAHEGDTLAYENEIMLSRQGSPPAVVELHWSLFDSPHYQHALSDEWLWETALPVRIGSAPALMLGAEAQLAHLCGHLMLHHGGADLRLLWLHDVAEALLFYGDRLDWDELLRRAQAYDLVLSLQTVLLRVIDEWQVPVPPPTIERLRALQPSPQEERLFGWLVAPAQPVARRFWIDLASMPGWGQRLRYAWTSLFPSPTYMQQRYRLRHWLLVPFSYPYRWFLGLRGLLRRPVRPG